MLCLFCWSSILSIRIFQFWFRVDVNKHWKTRKYFDVTIKNNLKRIKFLRFSKYSTVKISPFSRSEDDRSECMRREERRETLSHTSSCEGGISCIKAWATTRSHNIFQVNFRFSSHFCHVKEWSYCFFLCSYQKLSFEIFSSKVQKWNIWQFCLYVPLDLPLQVRINFYVYTHRYVIIMRNR